MRKNWLLEHLEKLRVFHCVVKRGSLVRAAAELGVSQPAVSRLVQTLEIASGLKLLERSRLGCLPTRQGELLVEFYERLKPMADDVAQKLSSDEELSGCLSLAAFESFAVTWWPAFYKEMVVQCPGLTFSLQTSAPELHRDRLLRGAVDLIIEATPHAHERITSIKVGADQFALYTSRSCSSERDLPLFYVPDARDDDFTPMSTLLQQRNLGSRRSCELESFSTVYEFVSGGIGIGPLPTRFVKSRSKGAHLKRAECSPVAFGTHSICVSFLSHRRTDKRIMTIVRRLKAFLKTTQ